MITVKNNTMGANGSCQNCGKVHNVKGGNPSKSLAIIYVKEEGKRGKNIIVCNCEKCINEIIEKINKGEYK